MFKSKSHASALSTTAETLQSNLSQLNLGADYALFGDDDRPISSSNDDSGSKAWLGAVGGRSASSLQLPSLLLTHDEDDETTEGGDSIIGSAASSIGGSAGSVEQVGQMHRSRSLHSALASRARMPIGSTRTVVFDQFDEFLGDVPHQRNTNQNKSNSNVSSNAAANKTREEAEHKQFTRMVHSQLQTLTVQVVSHHRQVPPAPSGASSPTSPTTDEKFPEKNKEQSPDRVPASASPTSTATPNKRVDPDLALLMVRVSFGGRSWTMRRTTRAFEHLHHAVLSSHSFSPHQLPVLPSKLNGSSEDQDATDEARRDLYNAYLRGLLELDNVWRCPAIPAFLDNDQDKSGASDPHELSFKCELLRVRARVLVLERSATAAAARETALSYKVNQQGDTLADVLVAVRRLEQQRHVEGGGGGGSNRIDLVHGGRADSPDNVNGKQDFPRVKSVNGFQVGVSYDTDSYGMRLSPQLNASRINEQQLGTSSNGSLTSDTWARVSDLNTSPVLTKRADVIVDMVRPTKGSEENRRRVFFFVHGMLKRALGAQSYPLAPQTTRCYVPDEELAVSAFVCHGQEAKWFIKVSEALYALAANDNSNASRGSGSPHSSPAFSSVGASRASSSSGRPEENGAVSDLDCAVSMVSFDAKVIRCVIDDLRVKICANELDSLAHAAFLEEFDRVVDAHKLKQQQTYSPNINNIDSGISTTPHLFKRSLVLIKTWAIYEDMGNSQRDTSLISCLSEPALCVLVASLFNNYHLDINSPLQALVVFFLTYSQVDWSRFVVTMSGVLPAGQQYLSGEVSNDASSDEPRLADQVMGRFREWESANPDHNNNHSRQSLRHPTSPQADSKNASSPSPAAGGCITVMDPLNFRTNLCADTTNSQQTFLVTLLRAGADKVSRLLSRVERELHGDSDSCRSGDSNKESSVEMLERLFKVSLLRFGSKWRPDVDDNMNNTRTLTEGGGRGGGATSSPPDSPLLLYEHQLESRPSSPPFGARLQQPPLSSSMRKVASFPANINESLQYLGVHGSGNALAAAAAMGHTNGIMSRGDGFGRSTNSLATMDHVVSGGSGSVTPERRQRPEGAAQNLHVTGRENEENEDLLKGNLAEMWSRLQYCSLLLDSQVTSPALLALATEILADKGPLPVGEVGKMLQEATSNPQISGILKEQFGGLKKFIEMHPGTFVISTDHPFNPKVFLLASLTAAQVASIKSGDMSAVMPSGRKTKNRRRKTTKNNGEHIHSNGGGAGGSAGAGLAMVGEHVPMQSSWQDKERMHAAGAQYQGQQHMPQQQRHFDNHSLQQQRQYQQHSQQRMPVSRGDGVYGRGDTGGESYQQQNNQYVPPSSGMQYRQPHVQQQQQHQRQFLPASRIQTQEFAPQHVLSAGVSNVSLAPPGLPPPSIPKGIRGSASMVDLSRHFDQQQRQQQQQQRQQSQHY